MHGRLAGAVDTAVSLGQKGLSYAKQNPGKAAIGAGAAGALGYLAYKSVFPGFQPPVTQTEGTQVQLTQQRGQGMGSAQPPGGTQYKQNTISQAQAWQQSNQIPYIDSLALQKEQLRLFKEKENLSNDLALNQLYSVAAANPGVLR